MARTIPTTSTSNSQLVIASFLTVRKALHMHQKWISDHVIAEIASDMVKSTITTNNLNRAVANYFRSKADLLHLHTSNNYGIYKLQNEKRVD